VEGSSVHLGKNIELAFIIQLVAKVILNMLKQGNRKQRVFAFHQINLEL